MHRDATKHSQEMECEPLNNNPSFGMIKQQMTTAAPENDHSKSTNQLTTEQRQLEPQVCCFSDGLDSYSDDDSDGCCDLGLGEQVLRIIELLI